MDTNEQELADRLAIVANMLNDPAIGPDSPRLEAYIRQFHGDEEFTQLAALAQRLKRDALLRPPVAQPAQ